jgi:hypothetical protein
MAEINLEDNLEPTKTLELTEGEIERLTWLIEVARENIDYETNAEVDVDNNLLNKLNGK